ncbi:MAG: 1-(5-phosphoribosyl)-5-[(5-phosphoribosylamino)methylideneamino]imidazole-4-carboxamide isomerase [Tissierellia bacterium]|nr:1-(5-phosphoribosyl)-5-[(5-phosphoribosylamino)methylideneamino]imidazole-4-carboxamide isomerase [Tissierellia bacterium]
MKIFPAIDLKGGKCVRLSQGKANQEFVYGEDPVQMAQYLMKEGAMQLHIIDLDGAFGQGRNNIEKLKEIRLAVDLPIQVGGGIRTPERAKELIELGFDRLIIGTRAITHPDFLGALLEKYGEKICVSVDTLGNRVAIRGWLQETGLDLFECVKNLRQQGVDTIIHTDIERDGMLTGLNYETLEKLQREIGGKFIAAGGVKGKEDFKVLKELGIYGLITGKAIYEGNLSMAQIREFQEKNQ